MVKLGDSVAITKLKSKSATMSNGCIQWTGLKDKNGYGVLYRLGVTRAHRISYLVFKGLIPEKALICHKCDNPSCINPEHLFLGTPKINAEDRDLKGRYRNQNTDRKYCKKGHEFTEDNTYVNKLVNRKCRTCTLNYYYKNKEKLNKARLIRSKLKREIAKQKKEMLNG